MNSGDLAKDAHVHAVRMLGQHHPPPSLGDLHYAAAKVGPPDPRDTGT